MGNSEQEHSQERLHRLKVRQWVRMCILGFIILLCGGAMGSAATIWWMTHFRGPMFPPPPGNMPHMLTEQLSYELGLSNEQYEKVLAIFEDSHNRLEALRAQVQPGMDQEMEKVRKEIDALLTPEQQETWRQRFDEMQNHMHPNQNSDGPHNGPPDGPLPGFGPGPGPEPGMFPGPPVSHKEQAGN